MSDDVECSKKAAKRQKIQRRALIAATIQSGNEGVRISPEQSGSRENRQQEQPTSFSSQGTTNKGSKLRGKQKGKGKYVGNDEVDEVRSSNNERNNDAYTEVESNQEESPEPNPNGSQSAQPKKKRGPTTMGIIPEGQVTRMNVSFNAKGQPYGQNSAKLASLLGVLARTHVPVVYPRWDKIDVKKKENIWKLLQQHFIVDSVHQDMIFKMVGNYWRQHKCAITKNIMKAAKKRHRKRALALVKPANVKIQTEWDDFVKERLGADFQVLSEKFRKMRKKQQYNHTLSRMGYARLEHKMKMENPTEKITRVKLWTKAYEKAGKPVNGAVTAILEGMKACNESQENPPSSDSIRDDALARVLGPETRGRVRGLGFGATPSRVNAAIQGSGKVKELEAIIDFQAQRLAQVEAKLDAVLNFNQEPKNKNLEEMISSHARAPQSQQSSEPSIGQNSNLENRRCALLNWDNYAEDEVVAEGKIASTDPSTKVHHKPLGRDCWKVWVDVVYDEYQNMNLYRETMDATELGEAKGSTLAWPKSSILLLPNK